MLGKPIKYEKMARLLETLRRKLTINQWMTVSKKLNLEDNKREWKYKFDPNKFEESKPHKLNEPEENNIINIIEKGEEFPEGEEWDYMRNQEYMDKGE